MVNWLQIIYLMTSVEISRDRGCSEMRDFRDFPPPRDHHSHGSWDKSKNPYPWRNCIIPIKVTVGAQEPQGHRPSGSWGPRGCLILEWCDFSMGMGFCYIPVQSIFYLINIRSIISAHSDPHFRYCISITYSRAVKLSCTCHPSFHFSPPYM